MAAPPGFTLAPHMAPRTRYRQRPESETEAATWWVGKAGSSGGQLAPVQQVRLRSVISKVQAVITFHNDTDRMVRAIWIDFEGNEVAYSTLEPKSNKQYRTYATHPWIVRDELSGERMMLDGRQVVYGGEPVDVRVRCRPGLRWSRATHKHFPGAFRAATRALLLAHARQRERLQPGSSAPAAAPAAAGCPADEDVHMDCSENLLSSSCAVAEPKKVFNFDAAAGVNASAAAAAATVSAASPAAPSCTPAQLQQQAEQAGLYILHEQRHGLLRRVLSTLLPHLNPDAIHFMDIDHQHGYLAAHHQRAAAMRAAAAALPPAAAVGRAAASTAVAARAPLLHIGLLPLDLVVHIVSLMAPTDVRQDISLRPDGHPDILPALLPGDPVEMAAAAAATLAAMEAENAAAMETDHT